MVAGLREASLKSSNCRVMVFIAVTFKVQGRLQKSLLPQSCHLDVDSASEESSFLASIANLQITRRIKCRIWVSCDCLTPTFRRMSNPARTWRVMADDESFNSILSLTCKHSSCNCFHYMHFSCLHHETTIWRSVMLGGPGFCQLRAPVWGRPLGIYLSSTALSLLLTLLSNAMQASVVLQLVFSVSERAGVSTEDEKVI
jgi:hypothetical protein